MSPIKCDTQGCVQENGPSHVRLGSVDSNIVKGGLYVSDSAGLQGLA